MPSDQEMLRATTVKRVGDWSGEAVDVVVLSLDDRHRRRIKMGGVRGLVFLLDLPQATTLRGGDALVLEDGRLVEVVAAAEPLTEISGQDATILIRLSWHLGNRHLPVQVLARRLRIRRDPVIEDMLRRLGAVLNPIEAPFDPEAGAYDQISGSAEQSHAAHTDHRHHSHTVESGHTVEPGHTVGHGSHAPLRDPIMHQHERTHVDSHPHLQALLQGPALPAATGERAKGHVPDHREDHLSDKRDQPHERDRH
jgi:urease accessory protein